MISTKGVCHGKLFDSKECKYHKKEYIMKKKTFDNVMCKRILPNIGLYFVVLVVSGVILLQKNSAARIVPDIPTLGFVSGRYSQIKNERNTPNIHD
jgi:hypothetical protein